MDIFARPALVMSVLVAGLVLTGYAESPAMTATSATARVQPIGPEPEPTLVPAPMPAPVVSAPTLVPNPMPKPVLPAPTPNSDVTLVLTVPTDVSIINGKLEDLKVGDRLRMDYTETNGKKVAIQMRPNG